MIVTIVFWPASTKPELSDAFESKLEQLVNRLDTGGRGQLLRLASTGGIEELLLIPLYPHYAESTVRTTVAEARRVIASHRLKLRLVVHPCFYEDPDYIEALLASA